MAGPKIYDISPLISPRSGVFPGDVAFQRNVSMEILKGDNIGLSSLTTTVHIGAHADAPIHYVKGGQGIDHRDLHRYLGRCLVVRAKAAPAARIEKKHLEGMWATRLANDWPAERILVHTGSFPNPDNWNSDFNSFSPELIEEWARAGVKTIGLDTPSIDPEDSKDLPSHKMVAQYDLAILEGLVLTDVPSGFYTLVALPLKIENADASPVRAILVADDGGAFP